MPANRFFVKTGSSILLSILLLLPGLFMQACTSVRPLPQPAPPAPAPSESVPKTRPYKVFGEWYQPLADARGFEEAGTASWYGQDFHGKKTSSGEVYDMYGMTAAHKTLPLGTYVRVFNVKNNRTIDVRINDRGPFVRDRIIDLSFTAAKALDIVGPGTAPVKIVALGAPVQAEGKAPQYAPLDYFSGNFTFQVGAFTERSNAERLVQKLQQQYENAHMIPYSDGNRTFYRVRVGHASTLDEAERYERTLADNGFPGSFIIAE